MVGGDVISGEEVEEITVACVPDQVDSAGGVDREDLGPNECKAAARFTAHGFVQKGLPVKKRVSRR